MSKFLNRQSSFQAFYSLSKEKLETSKSVPLISPGAGIENTPTKKKGNRTGGLGAGRFIRRVSSIFATRKKSPADLKLVNAALNNNTRSRTSFSLDSIESEEDDIRRPSGLGSAVSMASTHTLPPSPYDHHQEYDSPPKYQTFPVGDYQRKRALSTPNLLRTLSLKRSISFKGRKSKAQPPLPTSSTEPHTHNLPSEIIALILSHLPRQELAICSLVSRSFITSARSTLYSHIDLDTLSPNELEKLLALLVLRQDLTDLVTTFICCQWPSFFLSDVRHQNKEQVRTIHNDALLTATFTLALERMSNLRSLTLPSFDMSLLAHHSAFALKTLTFLNRTTTEAQTKALFSWLDGQINITTLLLTKMEDTPLFIKTSIPNHDNTRPGTAPSSPRSLKPPTTDLFPERTPSFSPRSARFQVQAPSTPSSPAELFSSSTLLPNLRSFHATPSLVMLLSGPIVRRSLKKVALNINTTLYNGLRPAALMNSLREVTHLTLKFSANVDKRTFEKVLGAAGASLGDPDEFATATNYVTENERLGLRSLEISFDTHATNKSKRDEALYRSLQASLQRYKSLSLLRLTIDFPREMPAGKMTEAEKSIIDSWVKLCPTLKTVTLFSGAAWRDDSHIVDQKYGQGP